MGTKQPTPSDWREWRRMRAWQLSQQGWGVRRIADALGASASAVSVWLATARAHGPDALAARPRIGGPARLLEAQLALLPDFLWHGAEAYGFRGDRWTCARVARVIEEEFAVCYSPAHVSRLLKALGWTAQVPLTRAIHRNEQQIQRWREQVWPELKRRARKEKRALVFVDESGFYLLPGVVKTYGPEAHTPVVDEWQTHDHLSIMGGLTTQGRVYTLVRQQALTGMQTIEFLEHLGRQLKGPALVIWDRSPIHRRGDVMEFVEAVGVKNLVVELLPPYAPDLNPVEWLWRHLKEEEMANLTCLDLEELHEQFYLALARVRGKPRLFPSFFAGAGLPA